MRASLTISRYALIVATLFSLAFATQIDPRKQLARTWRVAEQSVEPSVDFVLGRLRERGASEAELQSGRAQAVAMVRGTRLKFDLDGRFVGQTPGQPDRIGTWSLSADGRMLSRNTPQQNSQDTVLALSAQEMILRRPGMPAVHYFPVE